ncbi:hypothetical protein [Candidatus Electrothrix sp.]|uniref:hypothetical protein n=1 Tax=Candidatus Electrothrix sp. TaxID=2170559 RepID=UPI004055B351
MPRQGIRFRCNARTRITPEDVKCLSARHVAAGYRNNNGTLNNAGSNGNYWSSTVDGTNARNLNFNSGNADLNSNNRANGFSVRCLKDEWIPSAMLTAEGIFFLFIRPRMKGKTQSKYRLQHVSYRL